MTPSVSRTRMLSCILFRLTPSALSSCSWSTSSPIASAYEDHSSSSFSPSTCSASSYSLPSSTMSTHGILPASALSLEGIVRSRLFNPGLVNSVLYFNYPVADPSQPTIPALSHNVPYTWACSIVSPIGEREFTPSIEIVSSDLVNDQPHFSIHLPHALGSNLAPRLRAQPRLQLHRHHRHRLDDGLVPFREQEAGPGRGWKTNAGHEGPSGEPT